MSKLRVAITTADNQAVGMYRVREPAKALREQGEVDVVFLDDLNIHGREVNGEKKITGVDAPDADVLVIQRPTNRYLADAVPFFQKAGVAVVVDLDDDLQRTADKHAQRTVYDPRFNPDENWQHLKRACAAADLVVISTPALSKYAPHGRYLVIRNYVPESYCDIPHEDDGRTIGWGGTVLNHPGDLQVTRGGVGQVVEQNGARFLVVGDGEHVREHLHLPAKPEVTGFVSITDYPTHVARFTVGIAPLEDSAFSQAKSWLKLLEYSSLGVPFVASNNTDEYCFFLACGFKGFLVPDRGRNWRTALRHYIGDEDLRREHADANRELVRRSFTIGGNAHLVAAAWEEAAAHLRGGSYVH